MAQLSLSSDIYLGNLDEAMFDIMYEVPSLCAKKFSHVNVKKGEYLEPMDPNCLKLGTFTSINPVN